MVATRRNSPIFRPTVDLFKFFWRAIELFGARVYEPEDYEQAIKMVASGAIDCKSMITTVSILSSSFFENLDLVVLLIP